MRGQQKILGVLLTDTSGIRGKWMVLKSLVHKS